MAKNFKTKRRTDAQALRDTDGVEINPAEQGTLEEIHAGLELLRTVKSAVSNSAAALVLGAGAIQALLQAPQDEDGAAENGETVYIGLSDVTDVDGVKPGRAIVPTDISRHIFDVASTTLYSVRKSAGGTDFVVVEVYGYPS